MPVQRCANGIYPGVRDFIAYFRGHLHDIKASYTEYVKIYCPSTRSAVDREVYHNAIELNFDSL